MIAPDQRKKLRDTIAALKAKTTGNGCTEAEAMTAAEKVAELLSKHGVEDAAELEFDQHQVEIGRRTVVDTLWGVVATFCHCKLWYSYQRRYSNGRMGFDITITERRARFCGRRACGTPFGGEEMQRIWEVHLPPELVFRRHCGQGFHGEPFASWGAQSLICMLERLKPAHTVIWYV